MLLTVFIDTCTLSASWYLDSFFPLTHFSCHINKDIPHLFDRIFPESLRWLLATQQYSRSKCIMGHIVEKNQVNVELDPENILTGNESFNSNLKISDSMSAFYILICFARHTASLQRCLLGLYFEWRGLHCYSQLRLSKWDRLTRLYTFPILLTQK